jgi:hypothetical protein
MPYSQFPDSRAMNLRYIQLFQTYEQQQQKQYQQLSRNLHRYILLREVPR